YLESMETTFLSSEYEGGNDVNPIPELCALAENNINFSHNETVGGFSSVSGGTWTVGGLVSLTSGIPLKTPLDISGNEFGQEFFLPGVTSLMDILRQNGYYQALMIGSDANFGNRRQYYLQHGVDKIYDLYTAREDSIVHPQYYAWWGMEDLHLFEYAKKELLEMSKSEKPFAFQMLTADTHHVDGFVCEYCDNEFEEQYENVLACSSRQVNDFIKWLKKQDFYKSTTVVICGDHPTMDAEFISRNISEGYNRKVYNCFINAQNETENSKNRKFCSLDMFPTILSAIGCKIEGERLGLGTNLFSSKPTLCELLGTTVFDEELSKKSDYYNRVFMGLDF
ncbi:MAG: LTA synthase family protein, partial [Clostridia bacterium]|nr:LTA synthase family protein [Clostridia bacterium]